MTREYAIKELERRIKNIERSLDYCMGNISILESDPTKDNKADIRMIEDNIHHHRKELALFNFLHEQIKNSTN